MFSFRLFEVDSFDVFGTYVAVADSVFVVVGRGIVGVGTVGVGSVVSVVFVAVEMIVAVGTVDNVGSIVVGSIVLVGTMGSTIVFAEVGSTAFNVSCFLEIVEVGFCVLI